VVAVAVALPALRVPVAWALVCATAALTLLGVGCVRGHVTNKGSADVVVVPAHVAGRLLLGCVNPLNWLKVLLGAVASLLVGVLAAGVVAAVRWLVVEGPEGILAAVRTGAWAHGLTYAAAVACFVLIRGVGRTRENRVAALYRSTRRLPEVAVAGATVVLVVVMLSLALAGPRVDVAFARSDDGLGWLPPGLRSVVDGLRDDAVDGELGAITGCLSGKDAGLWTYHYTAGNPLDEPDVATLVADPDRAPDQPALAAAALVADNHLAPWVEVVQIAVGDHVVLVVDRRGNEPDQPLTDAADLQPHTLGEPGWLAGAAPVVDSGKVLDCSARTPW